MASNLSGWALMRVFWRSLFLQASWNMKGMQNLGLAYALFPALQKLYPNPLDLKNTLQRHLTFYNTHPYMAAAVVGGILHHEERIARGEWPPEKGEAFKKALMGPLAAVGDGFFWLSLRPAMGALSAFLVPFVGLWAAVVFVVCYNAVHLFLRVRLFLWGYFLGERLVEPLSRANLPRKSAWVRKGAAVCVGSTGAYWAFQTATQGSRHGVGLGVLALGALVYALTLKKGNAWWLLYGVAALGFVVFVGFS